MLLKSLDGSELELTILNYQYPKKKDYDIYEWLMISIGLKTPLGSWNLIDPCLLVWEVERLITWLKTCTNKTEKYRWGFISAKDSFQPERVGIVPNYRIGFIEPELSFELLNSNDEHLSVQIRFRLKRKPDWVLPTMIDQREGEWFVNLELTPADFIQAANQLTDQLKKFPIRESELEK